MEEAPVRCLLPELSDAVVLLEDSVSSSHTAAELIERVSWIGLVSTLTSEGCFASSCWWWRRLILLDTNQGISKAKATVRIDMHPRIVIVDGWARIDEILRPIDFSGTTGGSYLVPVAGDGDNGITAQNDCISEQQHMQTVLVVLMCAYQPQFLFSTTKELCIVWECKWKVKKSFSRLRQIDGPRNETWKHLNLKWTSERQVRHMFWCWPGDFLASSSGIFVSGPVLLVCLPFAQWFCSVAATLFFNLFPQQNKDTHAGVLLHSESSAALKLEQEGISQTFSSTGEHRIPLTLTSWMPREISLLIDPFEKKLATANEVGDPSA